MLEISNHLNRSGSQIKKGIEINTPTHAYFKFAITLTTTQI
jgi:hypothetical protein